MNLRQHVREEEEASSCCQQGWHLFGIDSRRHKICLSAGRTSESAEVLQVPTEWTVNTEHKLTLAYLKRLEASKLPSTNMRTTEEDRALPVLWVMTTWYHWLGWNWKGRATSVSFGAMQRTTTLLPAHTPAGFGQG